MPLTTHQDYQCIALESVCCQDALHHLSPGAAQPLPELGPAPLQDQQVDHEHLLVLPWIQTRDRKCHMFQVYRCIVIRIISSLAANTTTTVFQKDI